MNTEITKQEDGRAVRGWIFYDAECRACVAGRNRSGRLFESHGFRWLPLQTPGAAERLGVNEAAFETRLHILTADGSVRHNADAFGLLCRSVWWLWPLGALLLVPGFRELGRLLYDWLARNRYCFGGRCRVPQSRSADIPIGLGSGSAVAPGAANRALAVGVRAFKWMRWPPVQTQALAMNRRTERGQPCPRESIASHWRTRLSAHRSPAGMSSRTRPSSARGRAEPQPGRLRSPFLRLHRSLNWLPFVLLPLLAIAFRSDIAPWVFMWLLAFTIYAGCKWLTYWDALAAGVRTPFRAHLTYLLLWPGMSFNEFVGTPVTVSEPARWLSPAAKMIVGAVLVWFAVPAVPTDAWLLRGWIGMIGLIMMLHFGTFHLLALALQRGGFNARPNMQAPLLARSLADFWGRRWNTGFNVLADRYGFRPLTPWIGPRVALAVVFLASGLIHDLVIALPAGGGYGLPTLYFALQAAGLFIERHPLIRRRPWLNRAFAWLVLVAPLGCLFPPVFVRNVILPMLQAIGAY